MFGVPIANTLPNKLYHDKLYVSLLNIQKDATEVSIPYMLYNKHVNAIKQYSIDH